MQYKGNKNLVPRARELRKEMTREERRLWYEFLRTYPERFQRQKILGSYIADFYCARAKLVIELDGSQHYETEGTARDEERTRFLKGYALEVMRIPNNEVSRNFEGVCEKIDETVKKSSPAQGELSPQATEQGTKAAIPPTRLRRATSLYAREALAG